MHKFDVIVIGGGAAGLMAAGQSAALGHKTLLLEKMKRPGRKLGITGKGRCNLTNSAPVSEFIDKIKPNGRFLRSAFSQFHSEELEQFMNNIGINTVHERGGRIFPESGKAVEVTNKMITWCKSMGVSIVCNFRVNKLVINENKIEGVTGTETNGKKSNTKYYSERVIITTGGITYSATGSTGDGYKFAEAAGHTVTPPLPLLVPLITIEKKVEQLAGLELKNIEATLWINDKKAAQEFGELYFMEFGVTGPVILTLSRIAVPNIIQKNKVVLTIDFKPALDDKKLDARLLRDFDSYGKQSFHSMLNKLLPMMLIPVCISDTGIDGNKLCNQVNAKERKKLKSWIKTFQLNIKGFRPVDEAIITSGGITTKEIDQKTMESKIVKGLYFAGEVIDLDGPTGGYNLQIAFSTAWIAARGS